MINHFEGTSPFQSFLNNLHLKYKPLHDGGVANYIPELAKVNPDLCSICVITVDGQLPRFGTDGGYPRQQGHQRSELGVFRKKLEVPSSELE